MKDWKIEQLTGYKPHANFYIEFSMSEPFGISAIASVYDRLFFKVKDDYICLTELSMVINWKVYEHYDKKDWMVKLYQSIWDQIDTYCKQNLPDRELEYYNKHILECCNW